jgi:hypothetical protein
LLVLAGTLLLAVAACSSDYEPIIAEQEEFGGPAFSALVITTDMAVGENRVAFGVADREGMPVRVDNATVRSYFLVPRQDARELKSTVPARFMSWPSNIGGVFEVNLVFDIGGAWEIEADLVAPDGEAVTAKAAFIVKDESSTPAIGSRPPAIVTLTAADVEDLSHISSSPEPDPDLYQLSVHEALEQDKPFVVVFATPAFCVSATCGPQVAELAKVKDKYADRANFIHVEVFKDPHLIKDGRPSEGVLPAVRDWGLPTEPWTFVIDADGLVSSKFEQFTSSETIEAALLKAF